MDFILSSTFIPLKIDASWGKYPIPFLERLYMGKSVTSKPFKKIDPVFGFIRPIIV